MKFVAMRLYSFIFSRIYGVFKWKLRGRGILSRTFAQVKTLFREDLPHLLRVQGDYLLRTSQSKPTDPRSLLLSLAINDEKAAKQENDGRTVGPSGPGSRIGAPVEKGKQPKYSAKLSAEKRNMTNRRKGAGRRNSKVSVESPEPQQNSKQRRPRTEGTMEQTTDDPARESKPASGGKVAFRQFIISREGTQWTIDKSIISDTVGQLVEEYRTRKQPVHKDCPNTILLNPIKRQSWELRHEDITLDKKIGQGEFGDVLIGKLRMRPSGKVIEVAVKQTKTSVDMNKEKIKEVMKEARLMRNIDHPNIVKLYGVVVEREPLLIVMELVDSGGLDKYLKLNGEKLPMENKLSHIQDAAWGIEYLHHKRIIHRDLAVRNCLVASSVFGLVVKISDFGLSREGDSYCLKEKKKMPIKWLAPETMNEMLFSPKSDVWAYGVLAWEVYSNAAEPYTGLTNQETKAKVNGGLRLKFAPDTPLEVSTLITAACWEHDAAKRSTMSTIARKLEELSHKDPPGQQTSARRLLSQPQSATDKESGTSELGNPPKPPPVQKPVMKTKPITRNKRAENTNVVAQSGRRASKK